MDKRQLRLQLRAVRAALSSEVRREYSLQVCRWIQDLPQVQQAQQLLAYIALEQEIDLTGLFAGFPEKIWGIPRCVGQQLVWHRYRREDLVQGAYGLWEPSPQSPGLDLAQTQLVLVPTLGCDRQGYRLGYGGGYYDRFLAHCPLPTLGVMMAAGWLEALPVEPWDQKLDGVVTEEGVVWFPT
ncbi:5-formyltetrahydrofolate cyclo-ligase [Anthocerotibacter panamensis]|uniref:5-formyltetrahydrofolate cyclo-ligase n=1 Tax=Anthocerotibacter panamensis TaxID=2857077 RepID=UPI001C40846C|nr:5-formyltetrahydrofolate cyclo-ligase [Anthocerotibacter panamensis]